MNSKEADMWEALSTEIHEMVGFIDNFNWIKDNEGITPEHTIDGYIRCKKKNIDEMLNSLGYNKINSD